jgi:2-C-methyl-D-erythritol 2,4-cyclodiphosphate synthase
LSLRVGLGWDVHRLVAGRPCILGGVELEHAAGPDGHSDGDAVLHALSDALLGAAGLDDLGTLFPDTDPRWRGADSASLLGAVLERVSAAGWRLVNADLVIQTEGPRIAPARSRMREHLAELCDVEPGCINVKGKTFEGLGELAAGAAVAVQAVVLLGAR